MIMTQKRDYFLRSEYLFYSYDKWQAAKDAVYRYSRSAYEKIVWEEHSECYSARLYDDLEPEEAEKSASLIREQGGVYVEDPKEAPSNTICTVCGNLLQPNELFCPICGMRVIFKVTNIQQNTSNIGNKAERRSTYLFNKEEDYRNAYATIMYGNRSIFNRLSWYDYYRVDLFDDLSQEEVEWAVGRIREFNGYYDRP